VLVAVFSSLAGLEVAESPWAYAAVFAVSAVDVLFPLVNAEVVVIAGGVWAAHGHLEIGLVIAAAALGGFAGDIVSYLLGRRVGERVLAKHGRGVRAQTRIAWARRLIDRRSAELIIAARFVPLGRTTTTLAAGSLGLPWRRFVLPDAVAALAWGVYASMIGYAGGAAVRQTWAALALSLVVAAAVTAAAEVFRRAKRA
jgi:membrane-associated protein